MGCIRDLVSPSHFSAKIVEFQRKTGAFIRIVTRDEQAFRILRNGLSHARFIKSLRREIHNKSHGKATSNQKFQDRGVVPAKLLQTQHHQGISEERETSSAPGPVIAPGSKSFAEAVSGVGSGFEISGEYLGSELNCTALSSVSHKCIVESQPISPSGTVSSDIFETVLTQPKSNGEESKGHQPGSIGEKRTPPRGALEKKSPAVPIPKRHLNCTNIIQNHNSKFVVDDSKCNFLGVNVQSPGKR